MDTSLHIIFRIIFVFILFVLGYKLKYSSKDKFWIVGIFVILSFAFFVGLRYGRGIDYMHYLEVYKYGEENTQEILFKAFNSILRYLGMPFYVATICYDALLGLGILYICKLYKNSSFLILPLFVLCLYGTYENLIRQFIAISFLFIAIYYLQIRKLKWSILFMSCAVCVHTSSIIAIIFLLLFYYFQNFNLKSYRFYLVIYILLFIFWDTSYLNKYIHFFDYFSDADFLMSGYLNDASRWFTSEGSLNLHQSIIQLFRICVSNCIIIYLGYLYSLKKESFFIYHLFYLGIIINTLANEGDIEIIYRIAVFFLPFIPILGGIISSHFWACPKYKLLILFIWINYIYEYTYPFPYYKSRDIMYIWDVPSSIF